MGKVVRVSNGKEQFDVPDTDLPSAAKDGYLPTERIIVVNSKTKDTFEIEPSDYLHALKDGYNFSDVVTQARQQRQPASAPVEQGPGPKSSVNWQAAPFATVNYPTPSSGGATQADANPLHAEGERAVSRITNELKNSDRAISSIIDKDFQLEQKSLIASNDPQAAEYANKRRMEKLGQMFLKQNPDVEAFRFDLMENPHKSRVVLKEIADIQPEKKAQIQSDLYLHDAQDRIGKNDKTIAKNIERIKNGELEYNITQGVLQIPQGTVDAFVRGWTERSTEIDHFNAYNDKSGAEADKYLMNLFDAERAQHDPDKPVPVAKGVGGFLGEMTGGNAIPMAKGIVAGIIGTAAGTLVGAPEIGPVLGAAVNTPEYAKRAFITSSRQAYGELVDKGMDKNEALVIAKRQGAIDGAKAAAQGALQTYVGLNIAAAPGAAFKWSPSFKGVMTGVLKESKEFGKAFAKNAIPNSAVIGGTEVAANVAARANGLDRSVNTNVIEAVGGSLFLEAGIGLVAKGFKPVGKVASKAVRGLTTKDKNVILQNVAKQSDEHIDASLETMVDENNITPEEAVAAKSAISIQRAKDSRIPADITNDDVRAELQGKIDQFEELQLQLKGGKDGQGKVSEAFRAEIKEKMDDLQFDIDVTKAPPEEQAKLLKHKQKEIHARINEIDEAKLTGKIKDEPGELPKLKKQFADVTKRLDAVQQKVDAPLHKAQEIMGDHIQNGYPRWTENEQWKDLSQNSPEEFLQFIAEQARSEVPFEGRTVSARGATEQTFGKRLTALAEEMFPAPPPPAKSAVTVIRPDQNKSTDATVIAPKTIHTESVAGVREKVSPLSEEPASQFEGAPVVEPKTWNKDTPEPFTTKNGHSVTRQNGELVVVNKSGKPLAAEARKKAIAEYADAFDFDHGKRVESIPEDISNEVEANRHVLENTENPAEIAEIYAREAPQPVKLSTKEAMIAESGIGSVKRGSYLRFGDRNNIGISKAKSYFNKDGKSLDVIAKELSDHHGVEISIEDVVAFMDRFPNGVAEALKVGQSEVAIQAAARFKELTGFDLNDAMAEKAINQQFEKYSKAEQELAQANYETAEQLQADYEALFAEERAADNAAKEGANSEVPPPARGEDGAEVGPPSDDSGTPAPPADEPPTASSIYAEHPYTELSHSGLQDLANEFSLDDVRPRDHKTDLQLRQDARETEGKWLKDGTYNKKIDQLVREAEKGKVHTDENQVILERHLNAMRIDLENTKDNSPDFDAKLAYVDRLKKAGEATRSAAGAALRIPTRGKDVPATLADAYLRKADANKTTKLTDAQKAEAKKDFTELTELQKAWEDRVAKSEADEAKSLAEKEVKKQVAARKPTKKTKEDFVAERSKLKDELRAAKEKHEKWLRDNGIQRQGGGPALTVDMVKVISKIIKSYVDEGISILDDLVRTVHAEVKDDLPEITAKDIHNIIAGEYDKPKKTRNELAEKLVNLRMEAKLQNKLESLIAGEKKIKSESKQQKYNQQVEALQKKIKDLEDEVAEAKKVPRENKTPEQIALQSLKTRTKNAISELETKIANGDFAKPAPKKVTPSDPESIALRDKLIKRKIEYEVALLKDQYRHAPTPEKAKRLLIEIANVPRTVMSSFDLSAPLRQGLVAFVAHPILGARAYGAMLKAAKSEAFFNRWFDDLRNAGDYKDIQESGLAINDPLDPRLQAREEAFMSNLPQKIPGFGSVIKGSERAYVLFLNKLRTDIFRQGADAFAANGKTFENSPELYKALAEHVNNMTGRGNLGPAEKYAPALNTLFFSPRLIASRMNMLLPIAYGFAPKEIKIMYLKDMAKFLTFGATMLGLAAAAGYKVEMDPRSTDFLKMRDGDIRIDVLGGFQQYVRASAQIIKGEKKDTDSGAIRQLDGKGPFGTDRVDIATRFSRGKLAPLPASIVNLVAGKDILGNEVTWSSEALKSVTPLIGQDFLRAIKDPSAKSLLLLAASGSGVGVQQYNEDDRPKKTSTKQHTRKTPQKRTRPERER